MGQAAAIWGALIAVSTAGAAPEISDLQVRPNPFSPNADGVRDTTTVSFVAKGDSATVLVSVGVTRVIGEVGLGTIFGPQTVPADSTVSVPWSPGSIGDGLYRFDVSVLQGTQEVNDSAFTEIDTQAPGLTLLAPTPNPFLPGKDNTVDRLMTFGGSVTTTDSTTETYFVTSFGGNFADSLSRFSGAGAFNVTWNGAHSDSATKPSGLYALEARSVDGGGNATIRTTSFTIDRIAPEFLMADTLITSSFPLRVEGIATDNDRVVAITVKYNSDAGIVAVDSMGAQGTEVAFSTLVEDPLPTPGYRKVTFFAQDEAGGSGTKVVTIGYDTVIPILNSTTVVSGNGPFEEGDRIQIRTLWNSPALTVLGNFLNLDSRWSTGRETVVNEGNGSYLISYEISRQNVNPSGSKNIFIQASTQNNRVPIAARDTVAVLYSASASEATFALSRNHIDPGLGETVTIESPGAVDGIKVQIYNIQGARVRELEGIGSVVWNGKTESNAIAASGTYWLHIKAGGEEEKRRLVVRRTAP